MMEENNKYVNEKIDPNNYIQSIKDYFKPFFDHKAVIYLQKQDITDNPKIIFHYDELDQFYSEANNEIGGWFIYRGKGQKTLFKDKNLKKTRKEGIQFQKILQKNNLDYDLTEFAEFWITNKLWTEATEYKTVELTGFDKTCKDNAYHVFVIDEPLFNNKTITQEEEPMESKNQCINKNTILYGPPGTGKTYQTIEKALRIIGEEEDMVLLNKNAERKAIKAQFEKRLKEGRIIFTSFHQSMSYEDFIEGIKPQEPEKESNQVYYKIEDGLFKKIVINAAWHYTETIIQKDINIFEKLYNDLYKGFLKLDISKPEFINKFETKKESEFSIQEIDDYRIVISPQGSEKKYSLLKNDLAKVWQNWESLKENNINDMWIKWKIGGGRESYYWGLINYLKAKSEETNNNGDKENIINNDIDFEQKKNLYLENIQETKNIFQKTEVPNYVLIIDEINRGNISGIFGELITLIEEDKRLGQPEELKTILSYSKKPFAVPSNLYIIGTMNTADRSVEALDTALRRRFTFEEMMPDYTKIKNLDNKKILEKINNRLLALKGRDYQIGHSYFMDKDSDLKSIFKHKIIPLLQEYFYGDYRRMGLVLGEGFVEKDTINPSLFAKFEGADDVVQEQYRLKHGICDDDSLFQSAIQKLLNEEK